MKAKLAEIVGKDKSPSTAPGGATVICILLAAAAALAAPAADRPNVIVVLVDDFGWADPARYGNTAVKTPNMDRLATEGVRLA